MCIDLNEAQLQMLEQIVQKDSKEHKSNQIHQILHKIQENQTESLNTVILAVENQEEMEFSILGKNRETDLEENPFQLLRQKGTEEDVIVSKLKRQMASFFKKKRSLKFQQVFEVQICK